MSNKDDPVLIDREHPLQLPKGWPRPPYILLPQQRGKLQDIKGVDDLGQLLRLLTTIGGMPMKHLGNGLYRVMEKSEILS